jgi:hypothetical protein
MATADQLTAFHAATPLHVLVREVEGLTQGMALWGNEAGIDVVYGFVAGDRGEAINADLESLRAHGFRARIVGRNRHVAVDLTPVMFQGQARYSK